MITRLALFGASGDLAGRFLLPALAALHESGWLPERFDVLGAATEDWDDEAFRRFAEGRLDEHAGDVDAGARQSLVDAVRATGESTSRMRAASRRRCEPTTRGPS